MTTLDHIASQLKACSAKFGPVVILPAEVLSVDAVEATVHIRFSDDSEIEDARLKSVVSGDAGFYALPTVGSIVQVAQIENGDEVIVVAMDTVDKIVMKKGTDTLKDILNLMIEATQQIVVMQGNNPNYAKLTQAKLKTNNLF